MRALMAVVVLLIAGCREHNRLPVIGEYTSMDGERVVHIRLGRNRTFFSPEMARAFAKDLTAAANRVEED